MKKGISILLAAVMLLAVAACSRNKVEEEETQPALGVGSESMSETFAETEAVQKPAGDADSSQGNDPASAGLSPAQALLAAFLSLMNSEEEGAAPEGTAGSAAQEPAGEEGAAGGVEEAPADRLSAEEIADRLVSLDWIPFSGIAAAVEPGYLAGFTEEIDGFAEGASFGPVISSIPFVGYIFRLEKGADTETFMQNLKDKADLRWNICTVADEMVCEAVDNTVFFVMSPAQLGE